MSLFAHPLSEVKRLLSGLDPIKTVIGLAVIPVLYGAVYLYANWDPYGSMEDVDAAVVNLDAGAEFDGEHRVIGDEVVEDLFEDASFGWQAVETEEAAEASTYRGDHQFALIIPEGFSEALASPEDLESAEQAELEILVNEANNYLLSSVVEVLAGELHESISEEVGRETADQILTGFGRIHQELLDAEEGAGELHSGSEELEEGTAELREGAAELTEGTSELDEGVGELSSSLVTLRDAAGALEDGAEELQTGAGELHTGLGAVSTGVGELQEGVGELAEGAEELDEGLGELSTGAEQVAEGNEQLADASQEAAETLQEVEGAAADRAEDSAQSLIDAGVIEEEQRDEAAEALGDTLDDSELAARAESARTGLTEAQQSVDELASGAREAADGAAELASGSSELTSGASELADALPELSSGVGEALSGASELSEGAEELSEGASAVDDGVGELQDGVAEMSEGASDLDEGAGELLDGLIEAQDGAGELAEGSQELNEALGDGAEEVPNPDEGERAEVSEVIGNPLNVNQSAQSEAGSYGAGLAPFFMGLALWIGTLVMMQVLRPTSARALLSNASSLKVALSSWLPFLALGAVQALLLYGVVVFAVGLQPVHPMLTLTVLLAASAAFTALVQGVVMLLGNPGKFVIIVLLVLQLVAAGGTFPAQTLPGALELLHPVLPLTYVTDGLRHVIYGADAGAVVGALAAMGVTAAVGLAVLWLAVKKHRMWDLERLRPPIEELA
ncbi:YhgE/Pip family protein [Nesterenkonia populi]